MEMLSIRWKYDLTAHSGYSRKGPPMLCVLSFNTQGIGPKIWCQQINFLTPEINQYSPSASTLKILAWNNKIWWSYGHPTVMEFVSSHPSHFSVNFQWNHIFLTVRYWNEFWLIHISWPTFWDGSNGMPGYCQTLSYHGKKPYTQNLRITQLQERNRT